MNIYEKEYQNELTALDEHIAKIKALENDAVYKKRHLKVTKKNRKTLLVELYERKENLLNNKSKWLMRREKQRTKSEKVLDDLRLEVLK